MNMKRTTVFILAAGLYGATPVFPQQQPAGIVTTLQGTAELSRPTRSGPTTLRFKEDLFVRDVINTGEKSLARVLFGGKSTVTVRELSRLEVREEAIPGGTRSIHELSTGAILVNVAKGLMRPGDEVQIRTPNAVAAIRGTIVFCECRGTGRNTSCQFATLAGSANITPSGQSATNLDGDPSGAETVTVTGDSPTNTQMSPKTTMPRAQVTQLTQSFAAPMALGGQTANAESQIAQAVQLANAVVGLVTGSSTSTDPLVESAAAGVENPSAPPDNTMKPPQPPLLDAPRLLPGGGNVNPPPVSPPPPDGPPPPPGSKVVVTFDPVFPSIPAGIAIQYFDNGLTGTLGTLPVANNIALLQTQSAIPGGGNALGVNPGCPGGCGVLVTFATPQQMVSAIGNDFGGDPIGDNEIVHITAFDANGNVIGTATQSSAYAVPNLKPVSFTSGSANIKYAAITYESDLGFYSIDDIDPPTELLFAFAISDGSSVKVFSSAPFAQLGSGAMHADSDWFALSNHSAFSVVGKLLHAVGTSLKVDGSLVMIAGGSRLSTATTQPLVQLDGGLYDIGGDVFNLSGMNIDPANGVATDQPVTGPNGVGTLLQATDGATLNAGRNALRLDTALLAATLPIIHLMGSPSGATSLSTESSTIELLKSKVVGNGPVIALDNGLITVKNGALISLTSGSQMITAGDLLSLTNGSKINVFNGPLISVGGSASLLDVGGALVNFGGSGGNQIVVNNNIAPNQINPTATAGIPVSGTNISVTNPIKNPALGSILINGAAVGASANFTGSLIQTQNGGRVTVSGQ